jgi:hypothetical protein
VGGDATARDDDGNTPLHASTGPLSKSCSPILVKTLLKCGAHLDEVNNAKKSFAMLSAEPLHTLVDQMPYLSLKCLAARVVSKHKIEGSEGCLHAELKSFVNIH